MYDETVADRAVDIADEDNVSIERALEIAQAEKEMADDLAWGYREASIRRQTNEH